MGLRRVALLDTAVASTNLGDRIIMEAVRRELAPLLAHAFPFDVATHEWMGAKSRSLVRRADLAVAGGTSLLSSHIGLRSSWKLSPLDGFAGLDVVLMGAGWRAYQGAPDPYSRWLLRSVLSRTGWHSARDSYSAGMLRRAGFERVMNTACPTLWGLSDEALARAPHQKGEAVVTTLNVDFADANRDRELLAVLARNYQMVYLWPQSDRDYEYAAKLGGAPHRFVDPTLEAYDNLLAEAPSLDYVGLRLHGGIRALQRGRRMLVVEVDNRAKSIADDFGLPAVERDDSARIERRLRESFETRLQLPRQAIDDWKSRLAETLHRGAL